MTGLNVKCGMCGMCEAKGKVAQSCNGHLIIWKICSKCGDYLRANHNTTKEQ